MTEPKVYQIIYTKRSLINVNTIKQYLLYKFAQREVNNLYQMLSDFENIAVSFPQLYPLILNSKKIRRAVLSKQLSVFYTCPKE